MFNLFKKSEQYETLAADYRHLAGCYADLEAFLLKIGGNVDLWRIRKKIVKKNK